MDKLYKNQKFESAKARIVTALKNTKTRQYTQKAAANLIASFKDGEVTPEAFKAAAEAAGATVVQTGELG